MTIQDWGALGEVVGAIAVLVTLIYLSIQLRANTAMNRAIIRQHLADALRELGAIGLEDESFSKMLHKVDISTLVKMERHYLRKKLVALHDSW